VSSMLALKLPRAEMREPRKKHALTKKERYGYVPNNEDEQW